jgi:hypothetical protein
MIGIAIWHFCVLLPDRFAGGIVGAFVAALGGAVVSGYALPSPGIPVDNPPGIGAAIWAVPGSLIALAALYLYGARREREAA